MPNRYLTDREALLQQLAEELGEHQIETVHELIETQTFINKNVKKRVQLLRNLKLLLLPTHYKTVCLCLDLTELAETPDKLTVLENRANLHYLMQQDIVLPDWLSPQDALELMELQNTEHAAFGLPNPWTTEYIHKFKKEHNL